MSGADVPAALAEVASVGREYAEKQASGADWTDEQMSAWGEREHAALERLARAVPRSPRELAEKMAVLLGSVLAPHGAAYAMSAPEVLGLGNLVEDARRIAAEFQPMPSRRVH